MTGLPSAYHASWLLVLGLASVSAFIASPQALLRRWSSAPSLIHTGRIGGPNLAAASSRLRNRPALPVAWLCQDSGIELDLPGTHDVTGLTRLDRELQDLVLEVAETVGYQVDDIIWVVDGLAVWKTALKRGRLPDANLDNGVSKSKRPSSSSWDLWPAEPLLSRLTTALAELQLPRFVQRHPELADAVLRSLLRVVLDYEEQQMEQAMEAAVKEEKDGDQGEEQEREENEPGADEDESANEEDLLAEKLVENLKDEWGPAVGGVRMLDSMFGSEHGMLDLEGGKGGGGGYGLQDGVWKHDGWKVVPQLQAQLKEMSELRRLVHSLGKRAAVDGKVLKKLPPEQPFAESSTGVAQDPLSPQTVTGMELSDNLSRMLPAEALLTRSSKASARRLFLAKLADKKLLSYQLSGWRELPSRPKVHARFFPRQPVGPGGPIIVCLDTSWSMEGFRETLAKAVVLEAVTVAHKQQRSVHVAAFSSENNVMACGEMRADKEGVELLLDFLGSSFKGGTDVTGALKHAMAQLGGDRPSPAHASGSLAEDEKDGRAGLFGADILLVTDGELPNPPVSDELLQELTTLQEQSGMTVHGLLVGRNESKPLEMICTHVHNFLCAFDLSAQQMTPSPAASLFGGFRSFGGAVSMRAKRRRDGDEDLTAQLDELWEDDDECIGAGGRGRNGRGGGGRSGGKKQGRSAAAEASSDFETTGDAFWDRVDTAFASLVEASQTEAAMASGSDSSMEFEAVVDGGKGSLRADLQRTIKVLQAGLVERETEVRLLLLAALCGEHLLLLGPPGTAKSELGRRLAGLSSGFFFQRLLTRFTTPEELFGPLSLAALEDDRYVRMTEGYLPTAKVAFLDEVFKANSAILNTLLTILNERQFDNGLQRTTVPLVCLVGASNELPDSEELDALYDRFLIRREVQPVSDDNILDLLGSVGMQEESESEQQSLLLEQLTGTITEEDTAKVAAPNDILLLLKDVRIFLREELEIVLSDRRLLKAANMLKVSAASHGRTKISALDCMLLQDCLWSLPEEKDTIQDWLWSHIIPPSSKTQVDFLLEGLRSKASESLTKSGGCVIAEEGASKDIVAQIESVQSELGKVRTMLTERVATMAEHEAEIRAADNHLWLDPVQAASARQMLLPVATARKEELLSALSGAIAFQKILDGSIEPELRSSLLETLFESEHGPGGRDESFTAEELAWSMKEAKRELPTERFRQWKRQRKAANRRS